jgi:hypothetical protein
VTDSNPVARTRKPKVVAEPATNAVEADSVATPEPGAAVTGTPTPEVHAPVEPAFPVEPVETVPQSRVEPVETVPQSRVEPVETVPVTAEPAVVSEGEPVAATSDPAAVVTAPAAADTVAAVPAQPGPHVVYVEAPQPPRKRGNRAVGSLLAIAAAVVFAIVYAVIFAIVDLVNTGSPELVFLTSIDFWIPVVVFAIAFILLVLIVNRAGWAAYVVGSLFVGVLVYFAAAAVTLLSHASVVPANQVGAAFHSLLFSPTIIVAALLAREVSLWVGFAIAARGRRVKARNVEARESYDRGFAEKRAEYERENLARHDAATGNTGLAR